MAAIIKELILVRHGKAEEQSPAVEDASRLLTVKGSLEIRQIMPHLTRLISNPNISIWSSPLPRASQTASIIAKSLGVHPVLEFEFIGIGDWKALRRELAHSQPSGSLVLVGHQPHLSELSEQLVGLCLPFKKGAAAGFRIKSIDPPRADLLWFIQPKILKRLSSGNQSQPISS